jgi:hypothetical protein
MPGTRPTKGWLDPGASALLRRASDLPADTGNGGGGIELRCAARILAALHSLRSFRVEPTRVPPVRTARLVRSQSVSAQRKPKSLKVFSGPRLLRAAQREYRMACRQDPPRATRRSPPEGPPGFRFGDD